MIKFKVDFIKLSSVFSMGINYYSANAQRFSNVVSPPPRRHETYTSASEKFFVYACSAVYPSARNTLGLFHY